MLNKYESSIYNKISKEIHMEVLHILFKDILETHKY